ncbi:MAG: flagellar basal body L-ring protein FlgH [Proteobacteria bacterium]|nr:flagellar basal body L-ring protein FlgH [Pseudomonadota bacterium]
MMCKNSIILSSLSFLLMGCAAEKLSQIGESPRLSQIQNPTMMQGYTPVSMPMPAPTPVEHRMNSLWQTGSKAFFKDQRACKIGDLVTVNVLIDNKESTSFTPSISRDSTMNTTGSALLGLDQKLAKALPSGFDPGVKGWINTESKPSHSGSGKYDLQDKIQFQVAATVIQILPNGNMVVKGRTEIKLLNEIRDIELTGIVRRSDIGSDNSITSDKVAEMRIVYSGRGDISDVANKPWGHKVMDTVMPF